MTGNEGGLPADTESEKSLLGILMVRPELFPEVAEILKPDDFYLEGHRIIFSVLDRLVEEKETPDPLVLGNRLEDLGQLNQVGGRLYLDQLFEGVTTTATYYRLAERVAQFAVRRQVMLAAREILNISREPMENFEDFLGEAEKRILDATNASRGGYLIPVQEILEEFLKYLEEVKQTGTGGIIGLRTHFHDLDNLTSGLHGGQLLILAARPGMGKTSFALNLIYNVAVKEKKPVAIFSLEMSRLELMLRLASSEARIESKKIQRGRMDETEEKKVRLALGRVSKSPMYIDDTGDLTIFDLKNRVRKLVGREGLSLVVVDYLQLLSDPLSRKQGRQHEVAQISRSLKVLAKEINAPVLALSQMSRNIESRGKDQRPQLSDLRESGAIEQDADIVMFIYREDKVREDVEDDKKGMAELILAKHRSGAVGSVNMMFTEQYTRFDNVEGGPRRGFGDNPGSSGGSGGGPAGGGNSPSGGDTGWGGFG